jgi:hypothetical protein
MPAVYVSVPGGFSAYQGQSFLLTYLITQALRVSGDTIATKAPKAGADSVALLTTRINAVLASAQTATDQTMLTNILDNWAIITT